VKQYFSLTINQAQPVYKNKKKPAEQGQQLPPVTRPRDATPPHTCARVRPLA
jgi:hypothetical protein